MTLPVLEKVMQSPVMTDGISLGRGDIRLKLDGRFSVDFSNGAYTQSDSSHLSITEISRKLK